MCAHMFSGPTVTTHFYLGFSPAHPGRTLCNLPVPLFTGQLPKRTAAGAGPVELNLLSTLRPAYRRTREAHEGRKRLRLGSGGEAKERQSVRGSGNALQDKHGLRGSR